MCTTFKKFTENMCCEIYKQISKQLCFQNFSKKKFLFIWKAVGNGRSDGQERLLTLSFPRCLQNSWGLTKWKTGSQFRFPSFVAGIEVLEISPASWGGYYQETGSEAEKRSGTALSETWASQAGLNLLCSNGCVTLYFISTDYELSEVSLCS